MSLGYIPSDSATSIPIPDCPRIVPVRHSLFDDGHIERCWRIYEKRSVPLRWARSFQVLSNISLISKTTNQVARHIRCFTSSLIKFQSSITIRPRMRLRFAFLASIANAAVVQRAAQPGSPVVRDIAPESSSVTESVTTTISATVRRATTTTAPSTTPSTTVGLSSSCVPSSICLDGFSCGVRFGG